MAVTQPFYFYPMGGACKNSAELAKQQICTMTLAGGTQVNTASAFTSLALEAVDGTQSTIMGPKDNQYTTDGTRTVHEMKLRGETGQQRVRMIRVQSTRVGDEELRFTGV
jgi:hypothetical protein